MDLQSRRWTGGRGADGGNFYSGEREYHRGRGRGRGTEWGRGRMNSNWRGRGRARIGDEFGAGGRDYGHHYRDSWGCNRSRDDELWTDGYNNPHSRSTNWVCRECQCPNLAARISCYKCNTSKDDDMSYGFRERPGDWKCSSCQFSNFAFRNTCRKCNGSKDDDMSYGYREKPGDWECSSCQFSNFSFRNTCRKCNGSKGYVQQHRNEEKKTFDIPEEKKTIFKIPEGKENQFKNTDYKMDSVKLCVGNLKQNDKKDHLLATYPPHAIVNSVFIAKKTFKGRNNGFVSVSKESSVKKNMEVRKQNCNLSGSKIKSQTARKRIILPGEKDFVRQPLPDRDYDLSPLNADKPYIHVLVDDVLMKILEYLPLKERIYCEEVCRRWQALLYLIFERTTHLELDYGFLLKNSLDPHSLDKNSSLDSEDTLDEDSRCIMKPIFSKMLLLSGKKLISLSISNPEKKLKKKAFLIIAQLCPNLEYLDVRDSYYGAVKALEACKNLKCFSAKWNFGLTEKSFMELISVLPWLESIDVCNTSINGNCFNLLPEGLKELKISFCGQVSKENLCKLSKACTNLEVLEMKKLDIDNNFLEKLGVNCTNLRILILDSPRLADISNQLKVFTKLISLKIVVSSFELPNIADNLKNLEELHIQYIQLRKETTDTVDFGKFSRLKNIVLISSPLSEKELMSLVKCKNLQYVTFTDCKNANQKMIKKFVRSCPEIKHIKYCKYKDLIDIKFVSDINEIARNRSEPLKMSVTCGRFTKEFIETLCNAKNMDFYFEPDCLVNEDSEESEEEEDFENLECKWSLNGRFWEDLPYLLLE